MVIGIIGAGASGMAAALAAAENPNVQVLLFERQARVGRKLQATGNGRCNLTNRNLSGANYHGDEPDFSAAALNKFSVEDTLRWFLDLGLFTTTEDSGRVYPYSDHANSVVDVLRFALEKPNIRLLTGFDVSRVKKQGDSFHVIGSETHCCDRLIIACGGLAGSKLGGSMSGYQILRGLGHRCTRLRPSLVQLRSNWKGCVSLKGVRANCVAQIWHDDSLHGESRGEIQFTEMGLSGPVIFEISRDACQKPGLWRCILDLLPDVSEEALLQALKRRTSRDQSAEELLTGILHNRLGRVLTAAAGIHPQMKLSHLCDAQLREVCRLAKHLEVDLTEALGMDSAQVTAGGIVTADFDPETMESKLCKGLFACGEVLDVDGDCGGYNLQWAWSSGRLAGMSAGCTE